MTARKVKLGITTFWPDLEPLPRLRGHCWSCGRGMLAGHEATRLHRRRTRPRVYARRSGDWLNRRPAVMVDPYGDNRDWEREEQDAIAAGEYEPGQG